MQEHMRRVRVSAGAKVPWMTVTVVPTHGALQNNTECFKKRFAAIRIPVSFRFAQFACTLQCTKL
jgi:hypothetical protein